ncbi:MAG: sigma-70 family RNA polymerase sigma factor, partial [Clostridia bacterium]|nr:sigma-70 family RNA polymerase sigma factor [Clostridia bacterium]
MEKSKADALITGYLQKIYGFAYKKSFSYDEAEELAAEMTAEAYRALLGAEEIVNPEGYIWRICEHTYAKYVSRVKRQSGVSIDEMGDIPYYDEIADDEGETDRLRREIAFLSSQRREIVFRFYYKNEPIRSIASRLAVPVGTVKWHLNKARKELKEGFIMERKIGELGIHPVEATDFGHSGTPGEHGGPEYYLGDKLNLNIVYSVYFEPKNQ